MEDYIARPAGRLLHRPRRQPAVEPRALPAGRAVRASTCSSARPCRWTRDANSSTVTLGRLAGFGGAPNMGHDPRGRRHASDAWLEPDDRSEGAGRARPQAGGADGRDLQEGRRADLRRDARRGRGRPQQRHADRAGDDLRRRRHPRRDRGRHRLPLQGRGRRGAARGASPRWPAPPRSACGRSAKRTAELRGPRHRRLSRGSRRQPAAGEPLAAGGAQSSTTWWPGPAGCTSRRPGSAAGDRPWASPFPLTLDASPCSADLDAPRRSRRLGAGRGSGADPEARRWSTGAAPARIATSTWRRCAARARALAPGLPRHGRGRPRPPAGPVAARRTGRDRPRRRDPHDGGDRRQQRPSRRDLGAGVAAGRHGDRRPGRRPPHRCRRPPRSRACPTASRRSAPSNGERARQRMASTGARGEAQAGFPHVVDVGLPALRASARRRSDRDRGAAGRAAGDHGLARRHLPAASRRPPGAGGGADRRPRRAGRRRHRHPGRPRGAAGARCRPPRRWVSPGGAADLLAATLFLDRHRRRSFAPWNA